MDKPLLTREKFIKSLEHYGSFNSMDMERAYDIGYDEGYSACYLKIHEILEIISKDKD